MHYTQYMCFCMHLCPFELFYFVYCIHVWYITASLHIFELPFINDHFQVSGATSSRGYGSVVSGVVGAQSFAGARNPTGNDQEKSGLLANHDFIKSHWWVLLPLLAQRIETASTLQRFMYFEWLCCQWWLAHPGSWVYKQAVAYYIYTSH